MSSGKVGLLEVLGPDAGVEPADPEEDGVGAVLDRRPHAVPFAGRGEDFGLAEGGKEAGGGHADRKTQSALPCKEQFGPATGRGRFRDCPGPPLPP